MTNIDEIIRLMKNAGIARDKIDSLTVDESLQDQGLDSYDRMSLLTEIEDKFDLELPDQVSNQLRTVNDIVNYLNSIDPSAPSTGP